METLWVDHKHGFLDIYDRLAKTKLQRSNTPSGWQYFMQDVQYVKYKKLLKLIIIPIIITVFDFFLLSEAKSRITEGLSPHKQLEVRISFQS